jgi:hypothetical protein
LFFETLAFSCDLEGQRKSVSSADNRQGGRKENNDRQNVVIATLECSQNDESKSRKIGASRLYSGPPMRADAR